MNKFICMVGLPASGKSTYAIALSKQYNATICSSDRIREELFNDINDQAHNTDVFNELHKRIKNYLQNGQSVIMDSTNISYKQRMSFLQQLNNIPCEKICVLMATPYEECLRRNKQRDRKVPEHVIERMYRTFDVPWYYEGWDEIWVEYASGSENSLGWAREWIEGVKEYNQDTKYHTLTLGEHCRQATKYIMDNVTDGINLSALRYAAMIHDCGKPFCKTFTNTKGETTTQAHYYGHEHVGSYDSLFYETTCYNLRVAILIRWHMQLYFIKEEKTLNKYLKLWGEELYHDLLNLHKADKAAH